MPEDTQDRTDTGQFTEKVSPDDVLAVFDDCEPRTSNEIADAFDVSRRAALNKLTELVERGDLQRKDVGARATVFWRPDTER